VEVKLSRVLAESYRGVIQKNGEIYRVVRDQLPPRPPQIVRIEALSAQPEPFDKALMEDAGQQMDHYICDADSLDERTALGTPPVGLRSSPQLMSTKECHKGFHTTYLYLSPGSSVTPWRVEDGDAGSTNRHLGGMVKLWVLIPSWQRVQFEAFLSQVSGYKATCSQFVRHANVIVPTSLLRKWQIEHSIVL
jgi:JmjC domain, hydroxylase